MPVADVIERLGVSNSYFQQYRLRLINSGVIDSPKEGLVQIAVPYLQEHLASSVGR